MSTSERQSNLDQTLTSVISLLENEQTLKKVRPVSRHLVAVIGADELDYQGGIGTY